MPCPGMVNTESLDRLSGLDMELHGKAPCLKFDRWLSQVFRCRCCSGADSHLHCELSAAAFLSGLLLLFIIISIMPATGEDTLPLQSLNIRESTIIALEKSPRLKNVIAKIREAESSIACVDSRNRPSVDFGGSATLLEPAPEMALALPALPMAIPGIKITQNDVYTMQVSLKQIVSSFGRIERAREVARFNLDSMHEDYRQACEEVVLECRKSCLTVMEARDSIGVAEHSLESAKEHLRQAEAMYDAGVVAHYDVLRAQVAVDRADEDLIAARHFSDMARASLLSQLELDMNSPVEITEKLSTEQVNVSLDEGRKRALEQRPELRKIDCMISMAGSAVRLAACDRNPSLLFVSSYMHLSNVNVLSSPDLWQSSLLLNVPLYDGGATKARVEEKKAVLLQFQELRREVARGIALEVQQHYLKLDESYVMLKTAQRSREQAREGYRVAQLRYSSGVATGIEVTDALMQLTAAETTCLHALYRTQIARAEWEKVTVSRE